MIEWLRRRRAGEFAVAATALFALPLTQLALHMTSLQNVRRRLWRALSGGRTLPQSSRLSMGRVVRCTLAASKLSPIPPACLATALVAQALLQRHGYETCLKIGVRAPGSGKFQAHAWLERDGVVVVGGPAAYVEQYRVMPDTEHLIA